MRHPQAIEPVACNNTQKHPADSHCEATRANVIHCPASPHVVLGCHTRIRSGATDLAYLKAKSSVDSQKHAGGFEKGTLKNKIPVV